MRIPILTYQPMNIRGNAYRDNHLQALAADLRTITDAGFRVAPLRTLVDAWLAGRERELEGKLVALCSDDGADFDYRELPHPSAGRQRSVHGILRDFARDLPAAQPRLNATCFCIVSPQARAALDTACMIGKRWWNDDWWAEAVGSGLLHIANHSWDHNHDALPASFSHGVARGTFSTIATPELAELEIGQANELLRRIADNPGAGLFAYPYGEANDYLSRHYFPSRSGELGIAAAFTAEGCYWESDCERWEIPRFIFGRDWTSPEELGDLLAGAAQSRASIAVQGWSPPDSARARASLRDFARFVRTRVERIPGWMHPESALLTAHLTQAQRALGVAGPVLEIGVFKGKYLSVLYELAASDEAVVGVDLFVGAPVKAVPMAEVRRNIAAACGDDERLEIIAADSMELDAPELARRSGKRRFRFMSIDGGHTRELVFRDLQTATPLLEDGGIMALDDAFNFGTPGVAEGIARFFVETKPGLAPFAICYNKLFVTTPGHHERYLRAAWEFLDRADWLATSRSTKARMRENAQSDFVPSMYGYEVLPFL